MISLPTARSARRRARHAATALVLALAVLLPGTLPAQAREDATSAVFRRYADRTLRVQVSETGSAAKAGVGTGFFVDADGHVMTNYHVVSPLVTDGRRYRAELTDAGGDTVPLTLVAVDVVHDLAILASPRRGTPFFSVGEGSPAQGTRLYALGHPRDLGLSIVEGTYNGLLAHTLYPRIHFTGSLNPGMSGGPTLDEGGRVVGVNVSTGGDEVSFLVPASYAAALLERARRSGHRPPADFLADVGRQIHEYQDGYVPSLFSARTPTVSIGAFTLPTRPAPFFRCWADVERAADTPYEVVNHRCSTDDALYISSEQSSGEVELVHRVLSSARLNAAQFAALYSSELKEAASFQFGSKEAVTRHACQTRNVRPTGAVRDSTRAPAAPLRVQLCLRRYRKLEGLYDVVLRVAALTTVDARGQRTGVVSSLKLTGVSFENMQKLTTRYLESITWNP